MKARCPIIGLFDAGGARIQEGVAALGGYGEVFKRNVLASGVIPQISVIMGPCAGGDVYSPAMTDFIFMVRDTSYMFVTGPDVVKTVTNEVVTAEAARRRLRAHHQVGRRRRRLRERRRMSAANAPADRLPAVQQRERRAGLADAGRRRPQRRLARHAHPRQSEQALRHQGADPQGRRRGRLLRDLAAYAKNIVTGFGRIEGRTVGFVANQPMVLAGVLDSDASRKAARFVRFCDAFTFPSSPSSTCPASCPAPTRNMAG